MNDDPVVIVGGGVAGLAMANALNARGIPSVIFEKRRAPGEIDRGDVVHQSIIELMGKWQILDLFDTYGPHQFVKFQILNNAGNEIFAFDLSRDLSPNVRFTVLRHPEIERMLEEAATRSGLTRVFRGVQCVDLLTENGRVVGVVTSEGELRSRLTIIATGAYSDLRNRYFKERAFYQYPVSFYNARFNLVPEYADRGLYVIGPRGTMIIVHLPGRQMRIGLQMSDSSKNRINSQNVRDVIGERLNTFPVKHLDFIDAHVYSVSKSLGNQLWIPGAAIIGDAAHTTHPVGGQGMNLAFQDADVLSEYVATTEFLSGQLDQALATYSKNRRKEVSAVLRRTHAMAVFSVPDNWAFVRYREIALRLANRMPIIKRAVFRRIVEVR